MLQYEERCWEQGYAAVAGVDEVGRGCLFGDVVAAAVILPRGWVMEEIDDSKKLTARARERLYDVIMSNALAVGVGVVDVPTIERINIKQAARLAMKRAIENLQVEADYLLVDAEKVDVAVPQLAIIDGDALSQSIAAASIIAKVTRDRMCLRWDAEYPEYGIAMHKGYATKYHREKILEFGATPLHRSTFLRKLLGGQQEMTF
jgi:ribonuclease HII